MLQEERFSNIISYLKTNNIAKLGNLAKLNEVSIDTVRRDLEVLEGYGVLERVRGGAIWNQESLDTHMYAMRKSEHSQEKMELAKLVTQVVDDGQTIILGSGGTTAEIAKVFAEKYKRLTVITNDLEIIHILSKKEHFKLIFLGGILDREENATYGELCEREMDLYNADIGILAVNCVSLEKGMTDFRFNQIDIFQKMLDISQTKVIAADYSKFIRSASSMTIGSVKEIDIILTDSKFTEKQKALYQNAGIKVINQM